MKNITKFQKQYHGTFTYGMLHRLEGLQRGNYRIIRIKRLNKDGDALIKTKLGNKIKIFKFDFVGDNL